MPDWAIDRESNHDSTTHSQNDHPGKNFGDGIALERFVQAGQKLNHLPGIKKFWTIVKRNKRNLSIGQTPSGQ